jgi:hypothetical protein
LISVINLELIQVDRMARNIYIEHSCPPCAEKWLVTISRERYFQNARKKEIQAGFGVV